MSDCPNPNKKGHRSKASALAARESLEQARGIDLQLKPYRCPCGLWHLGHPRVPLNRQLRNSLRVGRAVSRRSRRAG